MRTAKKIFQINLHSSPFLIKKPYFSFARILKMKKNASVGDSDNSQIQDAKENINLKSNMNTQNKTEKKQNEENFNENHEKINPKEYKSDNIKNIDEIRQSFKEDHSPDDLNILIRFLADLIQSKKFHLKTKKADINLKQNIFSDLLDLQEVKETIAILKFNIQNMENKQFTKFISLLSKMGYYDSDLILHASTHILSKEMKLNTISISYMVWSLARFKIKKVELLDHLAETLIINSEVLIIFLKYY